MDPGTMEVSQRVRFLFEECARQHEKCIEDPGRKYKDSMPSLGGEITGHSLGNDTTIYRDDYESLIIYQGFPTYWWRQLAVDPDKVVWMQSEEVIHVTTRKAWEQVMRFRCDFLAERDQLDWHQRLGLDILLGPFERPQRRYNERRPRIVSGREVEPPRIILAPVVDADASKKYPTKIPKPVSGTTRQYEHWRVRSDRNLWNYLRAERKLSRIDEMLVLRATSLEFLRWSARRDDPLFAEFKDRCPLSLFENETEAAKAQPSFRQLLKTTRALPPLRRRRRPRRQFYARSTMYPPEPDSDTDSSSASSSSPSETEDVTCDDWWLD